jgi:superfamily II DNA or RNA helicase
MKVQPDFQEKVIGYIVSPELVIDTETDKEELIFSFSTYGWSYPTQYKEGIHKNGITGKLENPGKTRMKEACSGKKTSVPEEPFVIKGSERKWQIPNSISLGLKLNANRFAKKFDKECNKKLSNFRTKNYGDKMVGEEWYKLSASEVMLVREDVWKSLVKKEEEKVYKESLQPKTPIKLKAGLQEAAVERVHDKIREGQKRFKGIAPTGFGKTVLAWFIFTDAYKKGLVNGRVSIMTAPSQFLCNKNAVAFDDYNKRNSVLDFINLPIFSGSDLGIHEDENSTSKRKDRLKKQLLGYLKENDKKIILHVCNNSMKLISEILFEIKIDYIDLQIADEAHTLTSKKNNEDITGDLGNIRNFCLFNDNIFIKHRFFLTATEKNLINPDNLEGKEIFAFMNNEELFGDYAFQFSYAECVVNKLIVPFVAKIFEYSNQQKDVIKMIQDGIDFFMLDDLKIQDQDGDVTSLHLRLIRVLVSSLKIVRSEERKKLLIICSRNSHADLLEKSLNFLKGSGNYKEIENVNIDKITTPYYPKPENRFEELELIHESEEQHIIICGPWAITGVDCPSIDSILWAFNPGNEITAAQGTGRGTRTYSGKADLLVAFNLDLELGLADIKNQLLITISKLYDGLFPQHNLELRKKVRKIIGKRFLSTEKDEESTITVHVRALLSEFYDAAETVELFEFVRSSAFKNGGRPVLYSFDEIHEIAKNSDCDSIEDFFKYLEKREDYEKFPTRLSLTDSNPEYCIQYKKMGWQEFLGLGKLKGIREKAMGDIQEVIDFCKANNKYRGFFKKEVHLKISKYAPYLERKSKEGPIVNINNLDFDPGIYRGVKGGFIAKTPTQVIQLFIRKTGINPYDIFDQYASKEDFQKFVIENSIKIKSDYERLNKDILLEKGIPHNDFWEKIYGEVFLNQILSDKWKWGKKEMSTNDILEFYEIFKKSNLSEAARIAGISVTGMRQKFVSEGLDVQQQTLYTKTDPKTGKVYSLSIKKLIESGECDSIASAAIKLGLTKGQAHKIMERFKEGGGTLNYKPKFQNQNNYDDSSFNPLDFVKNVIKNFMGFGFIIYEDMVEELEKNYQQIFSHHVDDSHKTPAVRKCLAKFDLVRESHNLFFKKTSGSKWGESKYSNVNFCKKFSEHFKIENPKEAMHLANKFTQEFGIKLNYRSLDYTKRKGSYSEGQSKRHSFQ